MSGQHTAGPWDAQEVSDDEWGVFFDAGRAVLVVGLDESDARLIAAAPDLLAACAAALWQLDRIAEWTDEGYPPMTDVARDLYRQQLRAAVAKARGESS